MVDCWLWLYVQMYDILRIPRRIEYGPYTLGYQIKCTFRIYLHWHLGPCKNEKVGTYSNIIYNIIQNIAIVSIMFRENSQNQSTWPDMVYELPFDCFACNFKYKEVPYLGVINDFATKT